MTLNPIEVTMGQHRRIFRSKCYPFDDIDPIDACIVGNSSTKNRTIVVSMAIGD